MIFIIPLWATKIIRNLFKTKLRIMFLHNICTTVTNALTPIHHFSSSKDSAAMLYPAPSS